MRYKLKLHLEYTIMYWLIPIFYIVNGFTSHQILTFNSSVYRQLEYHVKHEIINRWNNSLTQTTLAIAMLYCQNETSVDLLALLFTTYLITDMIHMMLYFSDWIYYVHHMIPVLIYYLLWNSYTLQDKTSLFFILSLAEFTTPPISMAWTLSKLKLKGWYYPYISGFAYLNFFGIRILYFPYYWFTQMTPFSQMITTPFHILNIFWFSKMTSYMLKQ